MGSDLRQHLLLFGGTGTIGKNIYQFFTNQNWKVTVISRSIENSVDCFCWDLTKNYKKIPDLIEKEGPWDAVCWAQGMNCSDSVYQFDLDQHLKVYEANVVTILSSLNLLLEKKLLRSPARLCIISSIWQEIARQNKLTYCTTKAALHGLVSSAAADLGREGHVINAVLPGVIDTPMTRSNLSVDQISEVEKSTLFNRLTKLDEVSSIVFDLCRSSNTAVTGQFINVDLGFSRVRII